MWRDVGGDSGPAAAISDSGQPLHAAHENTSCQLLDRHFTGGARSAGMSSSFHGRTVNIQAHRKLTYLESHLIQRGRVAQKLTPFLRWPVLNSSNETRRPQRWTLSTQSKISSTTCKVSRTRVTRCQSSSNGTTTRVNSEAGGQPRQPTSSMNVSGSQRHLGSFDAHPDTYHGACRDQCCQWSTHGSGPLPCLSLAGWGVVAAGMSE